MRRYILVSVCLVNLALAAETPQENGQQETKTVRGAVFYVCGAGSGSILTNWAPGVRKGFEEANAPEEFREFIWQTGLGAWADQTSSVNYKRSKAARLAGEILTYKKDHPEGGVTLIGLSAGTAVVVYALESLPESCRVNHVILLGSSLDASYDMREALLRVEDNVVVFTSDKDEILTVFVPMTGSADRQFVGTDLVGICGFHRPNHANEATRILYSKIRTIPWHPVFAEVGDNGLHTDTTHPEFVKKYLVPIVVRHESSGSQEKTSPLAMVN
jgi:hypothetical protein